VVTCPLLVTIRNLGLLGFLTAPLCLTLSSSGLSDIFELEQCFESLGYRL
jgi:hypothetical protein